MGKGPAVQGEVKESRASPQKVVVFFVEKRQAYYNIDSMHDVAIYFFGGGVNGVVEERCGYIVVVVFFLSGAFKYFRNTVFVCQETQRGTAWKTHHWYLFQPGKK